MTDNFNPDIMDFVNRITEARYIKPLDPSYVADEEENEQLNLWKTPLIDNVNTWTLQFATGVKNVEYRVRGCFVQPLIFDRKYPGTKIVGEKLSC